MEEQKFLLELILEGAFDGMSGAVSRRPIESVATLSPKAI